MTRKFGFQFWLYLMVLAVLGLSPAATAFTPQQAAASPLEQAMQPAGVKAPKSGPAAEVGRVVGGPRVRWAARN